MKKPPVLWRESGASRGKLKGRKVGQVELTGDYPAEEIK
jgi:hypothetical protein